MNIWDKRSFCPEIRDLYLHSLTYHHGFALAQFILGLVELNTSAITLIWLNQRSCRKHHRLKPLLMQYFLCSLYICKLNMISREWNCLCLCQILLFLFKKRLIMGWKPWSPKIGVKEVDCGSNPPICCFWPFFVSLLELYFLTSGQMPSFHLARWPDFSAIPLQSIFFEYS